jgi:hypothetical protein
MQAHDLFPQVQKLALSEQLALMNFLVQLIQQEIAPISQPQQTILERMGGMPQHLLSIGNLSDRSIRRELLAERIQARHQHQP